MIEPTKNSTITLRELSAETLRPILSLEVAETQKNFVAPNAVSVAQAYFQRDRAWFRGIYADEAPVGFLMLYDNPQENTYFLWRFMIDARYQGMGYGRRAIELLINHVKTRPNATELKVSYVPGEGTPGPFYAKMGFVETGEVEHGENIMSLKLDYPAGKSPISEAGRPVTHIVLVKLKDPTPANMEEVVEKIRGMAGKIEEVKELEVGKDIIRAERSYDVALIARFENKAGLEVYNTHPVHLPVLEFLRDRVSHIVAVDFER